MGESNMEAASVQTDIVRLLFSTLDRPAYWLLGLVYQLFFNVASADLFSNGTIMSFYKRVQLIIGVFMMFQLAITILKGVMNPDSFTDSKNGATNLIKRVAISLMLLTVLVPINIPGARNEYERQLNNNGLLFGTLYSLQYRILSNNTLGRLILGTTDSSEAFTSTEANNSDGSLAKSSRIFTSTILKGFYRINLIPEEDRKHVDGKDDAIYNENRVCKDIDNELLDSYKRLDAEPEEIISMVRATCEDSEAEPKGLWKAVSIFSPKLAGKNKYIFAYMPLISAIVPFIFVFILLSFTIDVAVRAVKLAVLRLIAPIPIISYMDPKGGKDTAFSSWTKALTTTYIDLFIRLSVVYFVIYLIQDMIVNGIVINVGSGVLGILSMIIIWIGLFIFAKQAPKFIKQVLGMKDEGGKIFGGFGELGGVLATAASVGAGAVTGWKGSKASQEANWNLDNHAPGETFAPNRGKQLTSALLSGVLSGTAAGKAALGAKEKAGSAALAAAFKRNNAYMSAAEDGATMPGKVGSFVGRAFTGETKADTLERRQKSHENASKVLSAIANRGDSKAKTAKWTTGTASWTNQQGQTRTVSGNYQAWTFAVDAAKQSGTNVTFNGQTYTLEEANALDYGLMTTNSADYIRQRGRGDSILDASIADYEVIYGSGQFDAHTVGTTGAAARKYFKDESDNRATQASQAKREGAVARANSNATKPK